MKKETFMANVVNWYARPNREGIPQGQASAHAYNYHAEELVSIREANILEMKAFIVVLAALVATSQTIPVALHSSGSSVTSRAEDGLGNYKFGYDEKHATGGTFRKESGSPHGVAGSYGLTDIDGRQRVVHYVADGHGFRAAIKTNEPGTAPQPAAATSIAAPVAKVVAAAPLVAPAPLVAHASYAAPVLAKSPLGLGYGVPLGHAYGYGVAHPGYGRAVGYGLGYGHLGYGHY